MLGVKEEEICEFKTYEEGPGMRVSVTQRRRTHIQKNTEHCQFM